ncbi:MAG: hypothetical protein ACFFEE_07715, partial [Candidatus Thorarchaeota archaeon]
MNKVKVVAIAFAFTLVFVSFATQPVSAASRYDTLMSYVNDNYDAVRGGYIVAAVTRVDPTYGGISILQEIGTLWQRPPPISITMALDFEVTHQWLTSNPEDQPRYGGFMDYLLGPVIQSTTYHGLATWSILKSHYDIPNIDDYDLNATALAFWVNRTVTVSGGYGSEPDADSDILSTYYALASFRIIDEEYPLENAWNTYVNETAVIEFIE